ncbi:MAG: hypothetical protein IPJ13_05895 [Saprospiraceae bacterium]|nr:hypothetical protein [Saprospiraceae bacterium]
MAFPLIALPATLLLWDGVLQPSPAHNQFYTIAGAHTKIANDCAVCHNGNYTNTPNTCVACHTTDYNTTTNPNHRTAKLSTDCATCHTQNVWSPSTFNHSTFYPLTGAHATITNNCIQCHANGYVNTPNTCNGCHQSDFNASLNPNHKTLGISSDCASCHSTAPGWSPASFPAHNQFYTIAGAHTKIANDCAACHNGNYTNTPNTCVACHNTDYNITTNPNHRTAKLSTDCATCHTQNVWSPSTFNHNNFYPLLGAHAKIANNCVSCHNGNYTNTPNTCAACHTADYNSTTILTIKTAQFSTDCATCHTQNVWSPSTFNHNNFYPLLGAHAKIANNCVSCHNGNYTNTPNTCAGCHTADYNSTTNPNHKTAQFSTDCATCHTQNVWSPSTFNHNNFYPLLGAHAKIANDCAACHNGNYTNTPNTCAGCHTADYNSTTNPNHKTAKLSTDCATCHTQNVWSPSTFNHSTFYPLTVACYHQPITASNVMPTGMSTLPIPATDAIRQILTHLSIPTIKLWVFPVIVLPVTLLLRDGVLHPSLRTISFIPLQAPTLKSPMTVLHATTAIIISRQILVQVATLPITTVPPIQTIKQRSFQQTVPLAIHKMCGHLLRLIIITFIRC